MPKKLAGAQVNVADKKGKPEGVGTVGKLAHAPLKPAQVKPAQAKMQKVENKPSQSTQNKAAKSNINKVIKKPAKFQRNPGMSDAMQELPGDGGDEPGNDEAAALDLGGDYYTGRPASSSADEPDVGAAVTAILEAAWKESDYKGFYVDLFSGKTKPVTKELRKQSATAVAFDTLLGPEFDLCNPLVKAAIVEYMRKGRVLGVACASPCGSWSCARHGTPGSGCPPPLRSRDPEHIYGFADLSARDQMRVNVGNATMRSSADYIKEGKEAKLPVVLENGILSMLWQAPEIKKLVDEGGLAHTCDYCQHGTAWRKRTRFVAWNAKRSEDLSRLCSSKGGICDHTQKPHTKLTGWTRGGAKTREAEEYPRGIAKAIATLLVKNSRRACRAWK